MNIALLGYGVEGESAYKYYRKKYPQAVITVYDNNTEPKKQLPSDVKFVGGVKDFKGITADIAVKTPAIPPWQVQVSGELTSVTREFLKNVPAAVIGVTGSKGKGTTCSMIKSILDAAGRRSWLVGNIGVPALDIFDKVKSGDIIVYEMSSFQLWDCDVSPHVAVVLGIEPEHLDVHKDMDDYVNAKANIAKFQQESDTIIYRKGNEFAEKIAKLSKGKQIPYPDETTTHVKAGMFCYGEEEEICNVGALQIPGNHNRDNACAALAAVWPYVSDGFDIERGLEAFRGLPHRLRIVDTIDNVTYYDDSIATTPGSVSVALDAFEEPKVLIMGGVGKGTSFDELAKKIVEHGQGIRRVVIIGSEALKIEVALRDAGFARYTRLSDAVTMDEIVKTAQTSSESGDIILLSPGCASFDMFRDYADRGDKFIASVQKLKSDSEGSPA